MIDRGGSEQDFIPSIIINIFNSHRMSSESYLWRSIIIFCNRIINISGYKTVLAHCKVAVTEIPSIDFQWLSVSDSAFCNYARQYSIEVSYRHPLVKRSFISSPIRKGDGSHCWLIFYAIQRNASHT